MEIIGCCNRPSQYPLNVRGAAKFDVDMLSVEPDKRTISQATSAHTVYKSRMETMWPSTDVYYSNGGLPVSSNFIFNLKTLTVPSVP